MCTGPKNAGINGDKHLVCVKARIRVTGDHLVEINSGAVSKALEREGRALVSVVEHTRPSIQKMVTVGFPGGPRR